MLLLFNGGSTSQSVVSVMNDNTVCCQNASATEPAGETPDDPCLRQPIPPPSAPPFTQGRLCVKHVVRTHSVGEDIILPISNFDLWERIYFRARFYRSPSRTQSVISERLPRDSIVSLCHSGGSETTDRISERTQVLLQNDGVATR